MLQQQMQQQIQQQGPSISASAADIAAVTAQLETARTEADGLRGSQQALEQDLRRTKRAEQKLQALLFRWEGWKCHP